MPRRALHRRRREASLTEQNESVRRYVYTIQKHQTCGNLSVCPNSQESLTSVRRAGLRSDPMSRLLRLEFNEQRFRENRRYREIWESLEADTSATPVARRWHGGRAALSTRRTPRFSDSPCGGKHFTLNKRCLSFTRCQLARSSRLVTVASCEISMTSARVKYHRVTFIETRGAAVNGVCPQAFPGRQRRPARLSALRAAGE
jgi:hypothetical protein